MSPRGTRSSKRLWTPPPPAEVREWARKNGWWVGERGAISEALMDEYTKAMSKQRARRKAS